MVEPRPRSAPQWVLKEDTKDRKDLSRPTCTSNRDACQLCQISLYSLLILCNPAMYLLYDPRAEKGIQRPWRVSVPEVPSWVLFRLILMVMLMSVISQDTSTA